MARANRRARLATLRRVRLLASWFAAFVLACLPLACQSDLSENLEGRNCGPVGQCLTGYACDAASHKCVRSRAGALACGEGQTVCGGACVVLSDDEKNCRSCGTTCSAPPHGSPVCLDSECSFACKSGFLACGNSCVDAATDVENCGACGHACPGAAGGVAACRDGACVVDCAAGFVDCSGACVDVSNDPGRCG